MIDNKFVVQSADMFCLGRKNACTVSRMGSGKWVC